MTAKAEPGQQRFLAPRYWGTWLAIGILKLLAPLSIKNQVRVGKVIGVLAYRLAKRRRKITEVNIRLCFPELDEAAQKKLIRDCINENAIGLVETARAWFADPESIRPQLEVKGLEHLHKAHDLGRGVIVIGGHYTALDLGAVMASRYVDFNGMYRPHKNPLMDKVMRESRLRVAKIVDRADMRTIIRTLKAGEYLWYAPDQDYGAAVSVFAPFFGVEAATIKTTTRLAQINDSPVLVLSYHRKPDNSGYVMRFNPPLEGFPCGDEVVDATRINAELEREIRRCPEQYMWLHRRFKTRPQGQPGFYQGHL